ncbi:hypothetical protein KM92CIT3_80377 [uncultured Citrobacter sp.]|uniref:Uncharacterized protein n=1 Tax=uncultured Citrobacter sp. TaxID=200446 RepID=A0A212IL32_9ENTR|nr:hypothetical protein KM92CIT3_80377 [uncultured Citrobacter sp.]
MTPYYYIGVQKETLWFQGKTQLMLSALLDVLLARIIPAIKSLTAA